MKVKIKKLNPDAVIPKYAHDSDAGMDLVATSKDTDDHGNVVYGCGLAFEIPEGYVGLVYPRSSNSRKELIMTNSVGVIDSGYRGEVRAKFRCTREMPSWSSFKDRIKFLLWGSKFFKEIEKSTTSTATINANLIHVASQEYQIGDRFAQMIIMPYPKIEFEEVDELSDSDRGTGGYGSTGN